MDKFIKTGLGGLPLRLDDLIWEQGTLDAANYGIYQALQAQLSRYGTDFIVQGCDYMSPPNVTEGWIMLNGELLRVDGQTGTDVYFVKDSSFDSRGDKTFKDASSQSTYQVNRGVLSAASGTLNITTANRLPDLMVNDIANNTTNEFAVANIPSLPASKTTSGTFDTARIPSLPASKITSGTFDAARIPALDTGKITTGTFAAGLMPQATETAIGSAEIATQAETNAVTDDTKMITPLKLGATVFAASKITTGTFDAARIPSLDTSKITTGTFDAARIPYTTETTTGGVEKSTLAELQAGSTGKFPDSFTIQGLNASETVKGIQKNASTAEAQALSTSAKTITPSTLSDVTGGLLTKVIDIGDWDMDATSFVDVNHGLTLSKIRGIKTLIRRDDGTGFYPLDVGAVGGASVEGYFFCNATKALLTRITGGLFDDTNYNQTSYNRGWVVIEYLP